MNAGLYPDIPDEQYHADKESLSVSGAKKLLPPSCPAKFFHDREHGQAPKRAFDIGKAAHAEVLGTGAEVVVVDADNWLTKAAKAERDAAYAEGKTPVLAKEKAAIDEMAAALRQHPLAAALLDPEHGKPEVSGYWHDTDHDVTRRFRLDWLPETDGGRLIVADYKSCQSAEPGAIRKAVANYGYYMQDAWYRDGLHALEVAEDVAFVFIFQEIAAPYVVTVAELNSEAVLLGRKRNDQALQVYRECTATGTWPPYCADVELISLPGWATYQLQESA